MPDAYVIQQPIKVVPVFILKYREKAVSLILASAAPFLMLQLSQSRLADSNKPY
jgi:hypothetical protein